MIKQFRKLTVLLITLITFFGFFFYFSWLGQSTKPTSAQASVENNPNLIHSQLPAWHNSTRVKAAFVILTRNSELDPLRRTMQQLEARFNHKFNYPYVFLNDVEFTQEFKDLTQSMTRAEIKYGLIPKEHWSYPSWINVTKADELRDKMDKDGIIYGGSLSYRHMCRFESGFFYRHPMMDDYDFYWRVEPGVDFLCDIDYDPFMYMKENKKKYGWTISLIEYEATIPTLWKTVRSFMQEYPHFVPKNNMIDFISFNGGENYNLCHFWSNFEIGDLNFLRSPEYTAYFDYLDRSGGFFYERWGDAPIHSIAVGLFLNKSEVHFFNDIGYKHHPFMHCPVERELQKKCHCASEDNFDYTEHSCFTAYLNA